MQQFFNKLTAQTVFHTLIMLLVMHEMKVCARQPHRPKNFTWLRSILLSVEHEEETVSIVLNRKLLLGYDQVIFEQLVVLVVCSGVDVLETRR